ncbi:MAG: alpha/beta hydrolase [Gammaproteobacteria bacterium]|nr:alpha/beta hydrolase [Gammaproteobacteria bacterium]
MSTWVIVHGAWHTGAEFEATAAHLRAAGHTVHLPTLAGNRAGDDKDVGLEDAIASLLDYLAGADLSDVVLAGHSYGGMVITAAADRLPERLRRLVYWNAFVPRDGEALVDLVPAHYRALFDDLVAADGSVMLPWPIWREAFINDAPLDVAERAYARLNPHPYRTFTDPVRLSRAPDALAMPKSYLNCTEDTALPHGHPWHPRLSERLGLFRLVQVPGSHELCFSDPARLAAALDVAGRD